MTAVTLEQIEAKQQSLHADHARMNEMIERFKAQSMATEFRLDVVTIPLAPGERCAGPVLNEDGSLSHYLILMSVSRDDMNWQAAGEHAEKLGGKRPDAQEGSLLRANLRDALRDSGAFWLDEEYPDDTAYARCQVFSYGDQYGGHKSAALAAVVVRRFIPSVI
ncbi:DUF1566 domain-containing protein [Paraburkholderia sp. Ac-20342]|uniref:DUF1566 domain-containing protein n=1 Tax=Paraburkholderia sp. Ac-20342 TaxID=2703889 RepID=UPI00197D51E1|nr:DUF1566 domain-containing protein [Paraburkholderia sp. Ac-20342]MBN3848675.1 DUF1566 domain-containing protein [Paraburkholderia sp. Ac-20342]